MMKMLTMGTLASALLLGMAAAASAKTKTLTTPSAPNTRYELPGDAAGYPAGYLGEGRSIYRMEHPSTFYGGSDERGYPSGEPQNPQIGG